MMEIDLEHAETVSLATISDYVRLWNIQPEPIA